MNLAHIARLWWCLVVEALCSLPSLQRSRSSS